MYHRGPDDSDELVISINDEHINHFSYRFGYKKIMYRSDYSL